MFKVYYTITVPATDTDLFAITQVIGVEFDQLQPTLEFSESLRTRRRNGELIKYITMCSENPDSVGEQGVDDVKAGYDWKKRRV